MSDTIDKEVIPIPKPDNFSRHIIHTNLTFLSCWEGRAGPRLTQCQHLSVSSSRVTRFSMWTPSNLSPLTVHPWIASSSDEADPLFKNYFTTTVVVE